MKWVLVVAGGVVLIIAMIANANCVSKALELGRDIGGPLNRSQVAAKPAEMDKYMAQVQQGMEKYGLTKGYWTWFGINQNVDTDFSVAYQSVLNIRERLVTIMSFDPTSTQYQVGLDDIRGTIRELHIGQQSWNNYQHSWILLVYAAAVVLLFVGLARLYVDS